MPFALLRPVAEGTYHNWGGVDKAAAVDPGEYPGVRDTTAIAINLNPGSNSKQSFTLGGRPKMAFLLGVSGWVDARHVSLTEDVSVLARLNGVDGSPFTYTPGASYELSVQALPRPGGGAWTIADIEDPSLEIVVDVPSDASDDTLCSGLAIQLEFVPADPGVGREIGTGFLRLTRRPIRFTSEDFGPAVLDVELMDDVSLSHIAHPLTKILGQLDNDGFMRSGAQEWQRILCQHRTIETNLNTFKSTVTLRDRRRELVTFFDSGESRRSPASIEDGVAILGTGGQRTYARGSKAWLEDPGSGLVVRFNPNQRPIGLNGYQPESFSVQLLPESSGINGAAALTHTGSGTVTDESSPPQPLFDPAEGAKSILLTAGNPQVSDNVATWPDTTAIGATGPTRFSIDHQDDASAVIDFQIQKTGGGNYFDDSDGTFKAANTWNALPILTARGRFVSQYKIPLTIGDQVTLRIRQRSGGTASRLNRIYHAQIEASGLGGVATSRIVSGATVPVTREVPSYTVEDVTGKRAINNAYGCFFCELIPNWDDSEMNVANNFPGFFERVYDSNNFWKLYYNGNIGSRLEFAVRVAGVDYVTGMPFVPIAGQSHIVACRWLGTAGGYGLADRTMTVFCGTPGNVVRGSFDVVRPGDPALSDGVLTITPIGNINGIVKRILFTQQIFSDAEILAGRW